MKPNESIVIRRVNNGFLVTPAHTVKGCSPEIQDTHVFQTPAGLAMWLDKHFCTKEQD